jgi:hypothetical protein
MNFKEVRGKYMGYGEVSLSLHNLFFLVQKPNLGLRRLVVEAYTLHTYTHTHTHTLP